MQLLDLIRIAYVAFIQRRLLGIVGCLQVLQIALMPKLHIAGVWYLEILGLGIRKQSDREREGECGVVIARKRES